MSLPQLRIKSEYSFKRAYGSAKEIAERLEEIGCPAAGLVDTSGTWGHVQWEKALKDSPTTAMFGAEFPIEFEDGRKPVMWVLATDLAKFYRISSNPPKSEEDAKSLDGVIRFAGAALTDPEAFDYIDVNPLSGMAIRNGVDLHRKTGKPMVITGLNDYPAPAHYERYLAWNDSKRMSAQYILDDEELAKQFIGYMTPEEYAAAVFHTFEVAERVGALSLRKAPMISVDESGFDALVEKGRKYRLERGHIAEWTEEYEARLKREVDMIRRKEYTSYFLVVADMVLWAKKRMLVGPARGSSAGSLVCYLMEITEVDPLVHDLIFERFIDINRDDLPDIDIDFSDKRRHLVFDYLEERYGRENVARLGLISRLKPKSVVAHVGKKIGIPHGAAFGMTNVLIEHAAGDSRFGLGVHDTLTTTQAGKDFVTKYPEAMVMGEIENVASHTGQHAAGIIVSNVPVIEYCTVRDGIAQIDKKEAEYLNLLKIDALGLRTLGVMEDAGVMTSQELYDLKLDDPKVLAVFNEHKFSGVFQFEGAAQRRVTMRMKVEDFRQIDHLTALARPGPLMGGATEKYVARANGEAPVEYLHPAMENYLSETLGVVLYQEQVMTTCREVGQFSWEDTSAVRRAVSKSMGDETLRKFGESFAEGAASLGVPAQAAKTIWDEFCAFGSYGMNKSHTVSYAIISYWCAYLKTYHGTEYAAACLRNAKDDEQAIEILRELRDEGLRYVPFDPVESAAQWTASDGKIIGGFTNLVGIGPVKAEKYMTKRELKGLDETDLEKLGKMKSKFADLSPAHSLWGDYYLNPSSHNINGGVREFADLEDGDESVVICKLVTKKRRDKNEPMLVARRGGERLEGQTLFLDAFMVDDSVSQPVRVRTSPRLWNEIGEPMADKAIPKKDWFLVRGFWMEEYSMMIVKKVKCLTNKGMFV